jgi:adenylate kinase family enzyme/pimeloyl-ACP methyl ester carboxylesterase
MRWLFVPGLHCSADIWEGARAVSGIAPIAVEWPTSGIDSMDAAARWIAEQVEAHRAEGIVGHSLAGTATLHLFGHLARRPLLPLVIVDSLLVQPHAMFRNHVWDGPPVLAERVRSMLDAQRPRYGALRQMAMAFEEDAAWIRAAVNTGATFVYGGRGGEVDDRAVARRAGVPDEAFDQVRVIPGTSHFPMLEDPQRFYRFLAEVVRRSRIPPRLVVLGNTGSGKTTLARALARACQMEHLDLDTVVFDPDQVGVMRSDEAIRSDLETFVSTTARWVAEGSYADWADVLARRAEGFVFLNPGVEVCLAHQDARPWEPHKYDDPAEQERRRAFLREWTTRYPERDDTFGLRAHRGVYDRFDGPKVEVGAHPDPVEAVFDGLA